MRNAIAPVFFAIVLMLGIAAQAQPQDAKGVTSDPKANQLLGELKKANDKAKAISASFTKSLEMRGSDRAPIVVTGKLEMMGIKFRLDMPDQLVVNDGTHLWSYLKEEGEIMKSEYDEETGFSPDRIFSFSQKDMKTQYNDREIVNGTPCDKLTLYPKSGDYDYFKIELWLNASSHLPVQVKQWNRNGSVVTYSISNLEMSTLLPASRFQFNPNAYPNAEVIDNTF